MHDPDVVEIRELSADDWPVWRALRLAALAEAPYAFGSRLADWQGEGDREERWRQRLGVPGSYHVVALLDGRPVGMAGGIPTADGDVAELISMWVAPDARGRGVGDRLVAAVERWACRDGATRLRLSVAEGNDAAWALYERCGFQPAGEPPNLMPDGVRLEHVLVKTLDAA
jgi:ribosomal protein S18 acetylase RimI-like enzyme